MPITKDKARQCALIANISFAFGDFGASGVAEAAIDLPSGAVVTGGRVVIDTAFNSANSDVIDIGDGASTARYASTVNATVVAATELLRVGYAYTASDTVDIIWTGAGAAPSAGAGRLILEYIVPTRGGETFVKTW